MTRAFLGLNKSHDASAALVIDGELRFAVAQERMSRVKHHAHAINLAVEYVLAAANLTLEDLDGVVSCVVGAAETSGNPLQLGYKREIARKVPWFLHHSSHHLLHAYSTYHTSPFAGTAVLICDGLGSPFRFIRNSTPESVIENRVNVLARPTEYFEGETGYAATRANITPLWRRLSTANRYTPEQEDVSLGRLYSYASKHIFRDRNDAGKVMGLSAHGSAGQDAGATFLRWENGTPIVDNRRLAMFSPRRLSTEHPMAYANLAAQVQHDSETLVLRWARSLSALTGTTQLCLGGGVFLNCRANGLLISREGFSDVHVVCAPGDDGIALGAALFAAHRAGGLGPPPKKADLAIPWQAVLGRRGARCPASVGAQPTSILRKIRAQYQGSCGLHRETSGRGTGGWLVSG